MIVHLSRQFIDRSHAVFMEAERPCRHGIGALISVFALSRTGILFPAVVTLVCAFLAIRFEDISMK